MNNGIAAMGLGLLALRSHNEALDVQNSFIFMDWLNKDWQKKKWCQVLVDNLFWYGQLFFGTGFTTIKPIKFEKKLNKLLEKKKFAKICLEDFDDKDPKDSYLSETFTNYLYFIKYVYKINQQKKLKKLDRKFARECSEKLKKFEDKNS